MHCCKVQGVQNKVTIADSIHAVWADPPNESQLSGYLLPVNPKWVASQSTCSAKGISTLAMRNAMKLPSASSDGPAGLLAKVC